VGLQLIFLKGKCHYDRKGESFFSQLRLKMRSTCLNVALVYFSAAQLFLASLLLFPASLSAQQDIAPLIDQLVNLNERQVRHASYHYLRTNFLLYEDRYEHGEVLKKIVEAGMDGFPQLMEHLNDQRKINIPAIKTSGNIFVYPGKAYDFNKRTTKKSPDGVNVAVNPFGPGRIEQYEITVGDMCYFAMGQIVNRRWSAAHSKVGFIELSSPSEHEEIKQAIINEWDTLDHKSHRDNLIADFRNPDSTDRLIGAYLRLSTYYPAEVERLVMEFFDHPQASRTKTIDLTNKLVEIDDPTDRKNTLETFTSKYGEQYKDAIERRLFSEIGEIEFKERVDRSLTVEEVRARKVLHETFGWPKNVTTVNQQPKPQKPYSEIEFAEFIEQLTHDDSEAIGIRVKHILESDLCDGDKGLVEACFVCLASRDRFGDYLADRLKAIDFSKVTQSEFSWMHLAAIANSKSPAVIEQLTHITQVSDENWYFMVSAKAIPSESWQPVLVRIKEMLEELPADTKDGAELLQLVADKSPENAEAVFSNFLAPNTPARCNTVCEALRYNLPLAKKILLPLLDDDRRIAKGRYRIRHVAALTICSQVEGLEYNPTWQQPKPDEAIAKIKEFCKGE
jgi:hypothetical protein